MEIVIKIPESTYKYLGELVNAGEEPLGYFERVIMRGTPLPEHHGRLIDADAFIERTEKIYKQTGYVLMADDVEEEPTILEGSET